MIPRRFSNLRPYLASLIHSRFQRPSAREILHWITQPDKQQRAMRYVEGKKESGDFSEIMFRGHPHPFYYPAKASWIDLCQTIDECFNPENWHHFVSEETPLGPDDVVVDCGAAEGLFSFIAAGTARKVYAIEPIPSWHPAMEKTFRAFGNIELLKVGAGHTLSMMRMTNDEIYSRISSQGNLEIQVATLDSLFADRDLGVTFIKADVEGFEFQMLLGAEKTIRKNRPKLSMTVYHDTNHFTEMVEFLKNIHGDYRFRTRGIAPNGNPVLLQVY
jgi:FkbM family methyltransferase